MRSLDAIDTANLYINIGYLKKGLPDRAIEFYNYALPVIPDDANVYLFLARAYEAKGMRQKAEEYLRKARQLNLDRFSRVDSSKTKRPLPVFEKATALVLEQP